MAHHFGSLDAMLGKGRALLAKGPIALIIAEDEVELDSTIRHHLALGFACTLVVGPSRIALPDALAQQVIRVDHDVQTADGPSDVINAVARVTTGLWLFYCYNAEYLFYPFCETRSVAELLAFHTEERREAMRATVIDLYPGDMADHPDGTAVEDAWFDGSGYYTLARELDGHQLERQDEIHGGLRWRYSQEIPEHRRRLDRVPIFRAKPGVEVLPDHRLTEDEMNTMSCEWHHNITAAIASFRCAKALVSNAAVAPDRIQFRYERSIAFEWTSAQLMDLGFMEPGQWF